MAHRQASLTVAGPDAGRGPTAATGRRAAQRAAAEIVPSPANRAAGRREVAASDSSLDQRRGPRSAGSIAGYAAPTHLGRGERAAGQAAVRLQGHLQHAAEPSRPALLSDRRHRRSCPGCTRSAGPCRTPSPRSTCGPCPTTRSAPASIMAWRERHRVAPVLAEEHLGARPDVRLVRRPRRPCAPAPRPGRPWSAAFSTTRLAAVDVDQAVGPDVRREAGTATLTPLTSTTVIWSGAPVCLRPAPPAPAGCSGSPAGRSRSRGCWPG